MFTHFSFACKILLFAVALSFTNFGDLGPLPCLASGLFIGGDQPTIEQLVSACHQISARLDRSRFKVTVDGFYQNPKVARALTDTSLYAVWLDNGKRRCEFTRTTIGESQRNSLSWEFVYPDEGYIRVLRDPSSGSFKEATARLSAVSELEKKQAFNLSFSVLTEGWIRDNVDISLSEILQQSALSISRSDTGGGVLFALKATSRWGDLTTWHDPNVGFAPIRIVQTKKRDDVCDSRGLRVVELLANGGNAFYPAGALKDIVNQVDMSSFLRTKNGFVPTAVTVICREVYENGFWTLTTEELKFSDIEIDPVTSGPSDFTVKTKIPNGAPIVVSDSPGIKYEWQDGKIVKSVNQPSVANLEGNWFQPGSWLRRALLLLGTLGLAAAAYWYVKRTRRMA